MNCHVLPISRVFFWTFKWFVATSRHVVKSYYCKIIMLFKYNFKRVLTSLCSEIDQLWFFDIFWHFLANFLSSLGESKNGFGDSCGDIRPDVRIRQWVWIWRRISTAPQKEVCFTFIFNFPIFFRNPHLLNIKVFRIVQKIETNKKFKLS